MPFPSGIFYHAIGGVAAASFYVPFKQVKNWSWESYWLVSGVAAWLIMPLVMGYLFIPNLMDIIFQAPAKVLVLTFFFGLLWGLGGLTFGLSMRYLGISIGYAVVLGFTATFGTLTPMIFDGSIGAIIHSSSGQMVLSGVLVCLFGIVVYGIAGKEKEQNQGAHKGNRDFNHRKGLFVAFFSGLLSACMSFALAAGKPIAAIAVANGVPELWQNNAVLVVVLWGGFITNFVWCLILNFKNKSYKEYTVKKEGSSLRVNYLLSSSAGIIWYLQFFFYGMGGSLMGELDYASWTLHMTFIIIFSLFWGLYLKEWKGVGMKAKILLGIGLVLMFISVGLIGLAGNFHE
ncbi:L-rhamnose/proton symporter RhaT [Joostella atrarenae]|uniref:L-rhamnose/proton symporter RhaT n=1 Tax=Joostella atrarenae TaxID=679257 RepID=A0ABS9J4W0_9FLAO|nr:L-rhamnose/proton symporter RhaT [Joostella atrarenae]MCF8715465.1 L-rhamnose/proton symporter RhaT [Joostella atrarenae]